MLSAILRKCAWWTVNSRERRIALVIGNSDYDHATSLPNARNDASAIRKSLERVDFHVLCNDNSDWSETTEKIEQFMSCLEDRDHLVDLGEGDEETIALLYYSGHGLQIDGANFIVPTDADFSDTDVQSRLIPIQPLINQVAQHAKTTLIFLDACRTGFAPTNGASNARNIAANIAPEVQRSIQSGFAPLKGGDRTFIAFAADPDAVAYDGEGDLSPFTYAVERHIETNGLDLFSFSQRVARDVRHETKNAQRPWTNANFSEDFWFKPRRAEAPKILVTLGFIAGLIATMLRFETDGRYIPITPVDKAQFSTFKLNVAWVTWMWFGAVLGFANYMFGKRTWTASLVCTLVFGLFSIAGSWILKSGPPPNVESFATNPEQIINVLRAVTGGALFGVGAVIGSVLVARPMRQFNAVVATTGIGAVIGAIFFAFVKVKSHLNSIGLSGNYPWLEHICSEYHICLEYIVICLLGALWHAGLSYYLGAVYRDYVPPYRPPPTFTKRLRRRWRKGKLNRAGNKSVAMIKEKFS